MYNSQIEVYLKRTTTTTNQEEMKMRYAKKTDIDFKTDFLTGKSTMTRLEVPELCQNRQNAKMLH